MRVPESSRSSYVLRHAIRFIDCSISCIGSNKPFSKQWKRTWSYEEGIGRVVPTNERSTSKAAVLVGNDGSTTCSQSNNGSLASKNSNTNYLPGHWRWNSMCEISASFKSLSSVQNCLFRCVSFPTFLNSSPNTTNERMFNAMKKQKLISIKEKGNDCFIVPLNLPFFRCHISSQWYGPLQPPPAPELYKRTISK